MISRLTASAALFAILATAGLGFAAEAQQRPDAQQTAPAASTPTITLPTRRDHRQAPARAPELPAGTLPVGAQRRPKRAFSTAHGHSHRRPPGKPIVCRGA